MQFSASTRLSFFTSRTCIECRGCISLISGRLSGGIPLGLNFLVYWVEGFYRRVPSCFSLELEFMGYQVLGIIYVADHIFLVDGAT